MADDPRATTTYRVLKAVVIILGILIVLAFGALIVGGVLKMAGHHSSASPSVSVQTALSLPAGARIISLQTNGDRVIVGVHAPGGDEVDIFDAETGKPVARIRAAQGMRK